MKKIVATIITLGMIAGNSFAAFDRISFRMQGINPILAGIIADEYTDMLLVNPVDMLNISGYRFYTQLANLSGKGDQLFDDAGPGLGGAVTDSAFQFGFVGHPFKDVILPNGQMGFFFDQASSITVGDDPGGFGGAGIGKVSIHEVVKDDNSATPDNDFIDAGDTTDVTDMTGERYIETGNNYLSVAVANQVNDRMKVGIAVQLDIRNSEEPINATYDYVSTVVSGVATDTENNTQKAKEEIDTSMMQLILGLRYDMNDRWDIGGMVVYAPQTLELKRSGVVTLNQNVSAGAGAEPSYFTATGTDGSKIADMFAALPGGKPAHFTSNDATTEINGGFAWTEDVVFVTGIGMDVDAVGTLEDDGVSTVISVDSHYKLNDDLTLVGRLTAFNAPLDLKLNAKNEVTATIRSFAALNANDLLTIHNKTTYKGSGDHKMTGIEFTIGAEQDLPSKVKLGYGIVYSQATEEINMAYTVSSRDIMTYDVTNDGFNVGAGTDPGDRRTTTTETDEYTSNQKIVSTVYEFPIGLELQPFKKLKVRLGVTHSVIHIVEKLTSVQTVDGLPTTVNEAGGVALTTDPAGGQATTGDTYFEITDKERKTQYYYGMGYQWNENLSFDILNFSGAGANGGGLLELANWRIGATLLFGAPEEL